MTCGKNHGSPNWRGGLLTMLRGWCDLRRKHLAKQKTDLVASCKSEGPGGAMACSRKVPRQ